jgi:hypothetical protein
MRQESRSRSRSPSTASNCGSYERRAPTFSEPPPSNKVFVSYLPE